MIYWQERQFKPRKAAALQAYFKDHTGTQRNAPFDALAVLNSLGAQGWELIGSPEMQNEVDRPDDGTYDRAYWVDRTFWLKRRMA